MSRLLTRLPRTIPPTAPLQLTLGSSRITMTRGIVTDLETGGTRKAKQTAGKGFVSVGGQQDRGMPTSDKGDEPMPPKYSTSVCLLHSQANLILHHRHLRLSCYCTEEAIAEQVANNNDA